MEFIEVVRRRRMVRNFDPDRPVPGDVRERILSNALHAPSAGFSQGWAFLVLEGADKERYWEVAGAQPGREDWVGRLRRAPLLVLPFAHEQAYRDRYGEPDKNRSAWTAPYWFIDTGMASLLMLLTVVDEGLGACFVGLPVPRIDAIKAEFGVPDEFAPIGAIPIGYRAPDPRSPSLRRGRRPTSEVVHRGQWGQHTG
ncbi:nitroreductase family protein [Kribbella caucasensis]|nr:nitroreductase family protein [Kribbella sp. VKM Ac-2527]